MEVLETTAILACFEKFLKSMFIVIGKFAFTLYISCLKRKEIFNFFWTCKTCSNKRFMLKVGFTVTQGLNSSCSEGQIRANKVTRGTHYDAVATMAVPEPS